MNWSTNNIKLTLINNVFSNHSVGDQINITLLTFNKNVNDKKIGKASLATIPQKQNKKYPYPNLLQPQALLL